MLNTPIEKKLNSNVWAVTPEWLQKTNDDAPDLLAREYFALACLQASGLVPEVNRHFDGRVLEIKQVGQGDTLSDYIYEFLAGKLDLMIVLELLREVKYAMDTMNGLGWNHGTLRASNILCHKENEGWDIKFVGFSYVTYTPQWVAGDNDSALGAFTGAKGCEFPTSTKVLGYARKDVINLYKDIYGLTMQCSWFIDGNWVYPTPALSYEMLVALHSALEADKEEVISNLLNERLESDVEIGEPVHYCTVATPTQIKVAAHNAVTVRLEWEAEHNDAPETEKVVATLPTTTAASLTAAINALLFASSEVTATIKATIAESRAQFTATVEAAMANSRLKTAAILPTAIAESRAQSTSTIKAGIASSSTTRTTVLEAAIASSRASTASILEAALTSSRAATAAILAKYSI